MIRLTIIVQAVTTFFMALPFVVFSQVETRHIHGTIRDVESKTPIPFASVGITNTTRGTAADAHGNFDLLIKGDEAAHQLKISCIGYLTKFFDIKTLSDSNRAMFDLQSDVKLLAEITVSENAIDPKDIIKGALDSLQTNYSSEPFNQEFYSTLMVKNALTAKEFKVETVILGYCKGYGGNSEKKFEILRKRLKGENPFAAGEFLFWPTIEIHWADGISHPEKTGILNSENLDKFEVKYTGISIYEADTVYRIEYVAPKPTKKLTGYGIVPAVYKGSIYITTASHAIVKHEIETDQFQHSIIYKKLNGKYFPYVVNGMRNLSGRYRFISITNSVVMTDLIVDEVRVIETTNEFGNIADVPDDNAYWESNYPKNDD